MWGVGRSGQQNSRTIQHKPAKGTETLSGYILRWETAPSWISPPWELFVL